MDRRVLLVLIFIFIIVISGISFFILKMTPEAKIERLDRSKLVYDQARRFLKEGEEAKAVNAFIIAVSQYPTSKYSEKSLRELASIYQKNDNYIKATYYYKRLLRTFPDIKDAAKIQDTIGDLNMKTLLSPVIAEDSVEYEVQRGDNLFLIAKRFNTTVGLIKKINNLEKDLIKPGQKLKINVSRFYILVDKSDNVLTLEKDGEPFKTYSVSTGKDNSTPVGIFKIEEKMVRPVWYKVGAIVAPDSEKYELG
ncbi:MAG: LysM peptidoglycan-binding domain-containing protein, partial [Candidatus Omnitrophota bacterium]